MSKRPIPTERPNLTKTPLWRHMEKSFGKGQAEAHIDAHEWKDFLVTLADYKQALVRDIVRECDERAALARERARLILQAQTPTNLDELEPPKEKRFELSPVERDLLEPEQKMAALCTTFPNLNGKPGTGTDGKPWDPEALDARHGTASSGERACIRFVLSVYNANVKWDCGPFTLFDLSSMDQPNARAFAAWANNPWWA